MGKTAAEKIFESHLVQKPYEEINILSLDKVFCHEITTPIAINDLVQRGTDTVFDKEKIKAVIDHVTPAKDSKSALQGKILREWALRNGIKDFFDIGRNGVCHAIFPEKGFIEPGNVVIMGDSHTCTYGAFGAFAAGVGTTDLEVGILKGVCAFKNPLTIRLNLTGTLKNGVYAKDIILFILNKLGVNGATNHIIEFTGEIISRLSMEERMTICNMAVECGATTGMCPADSVTVDYLWPFIKDKFQSKEEALEYYSEFNSDSDCIFAKELTLDLTSLEPVCTINYKPDEIETIARMAGTKVNQVYIGSCTNGRISDLRIAAELMKGKKIADNVRVIVSPATVSVYKQALSEGLIEIFLDAGCCVTSPGCGACLGMSNGVLAEGEVCASTTNRNFYGRMGKGGMIHLMSPASAAATALTGTITNSSLYHG